MRMTRQHFALIASVIARSAAPLKAQLGDAWGEVGLTVLRRMAHNAADDLAATNPAFDRERFLAACGVEQP